jgi:hypothetical protein
LIKLIRIVNLDASDKQKKAELIANIEKVSGAILKLVRKLI